MRPPTITSVFCVDGFDCTCSCDSCGLVYCVPVSSNCNVRENLCLLSFIVLDDCDCDHDRGLYRIHYSLGSFDVQLDYQDQPDCQGDAPSVEISTRWAPADTRFFLRPVPAQPFSEWKLSLFYTSRQLSSLTH